MLGNHDLITLPDGFQVRGFVFSSRINLLMNMQLSNPEWFRHFVMLCRDPQHEMPQPLARFFWEINLFREDLQPEEEMRRIVLYVVEGDEELVIRWPIPE